MAIISRSSVVVASTLSLVCSVASADLKELPEEALSDISGQSGLILEVNAGSVLRAAGAQGDTTLGSDVSADYSNAGLSIDSQKWIIDSETYDSTTNQYIGASTGKVAGTIAQNIQIGGSADITIDAVEDVAVPTGGLALRFANTDLNIKVGNMSFFIDDQLQASRGGIEINGINVDGTQLVLRGNGVANP